MENICCLSLYYNRSHSFLYVNGVKICKFKGKDSEINPYPLCLGNIPKDLTVDNMKKTGLNGYVNGLLADFNNIDPGDIADIHKYLMKKDNIKECLD